MYINKLLQSTVFPFAFMHLHPFCFVLAFVLVTVRVMNALESKTVYSLQVFLCRGLVYEL